MTGMRPGEIRALKWEHIDCTRRRVYVLKWARKDGDGATKTATSRKAPVPMPPRLIEALRAHEEAYRVPGSEYVFTYEGGRQLTSDALSYRTGKVFRDAGFPQLQDAYVMRHTFCSIMYDRGMKPKS